MSNGKHYVIPPPPQAALAVAGSSDLFPVRRIWCVGRNYLEHIREMGNDERAPPFFFGKHADMLVPDGATIPYPPLTKDLHHEVELVVAMKSGGLNIPADKALEHVYGYAVGIDLTRRVLDRDEVLKVEPALAAFGSRIFGGTFTPSDESGDAKVFTQKLARLCAERGAQFVCALALVRHADDPLPIICEGLWHGRILHAPRGEHGFGYDPLFLPSDAEAAGRSAAELAPAEKDALSHRGKALAQLVPALRALA